MESPENSQNLRQKAVKSVFWAAVESWGRQAVSLLIFFALARLLKPETFGLVALASMFIAFVQVFLDQGLSVAIIQRREVDEKHLDTAFWTTLVISIFLTALSIGCAGLAADFFKQPQLTPIIQCLSLTFIFSGLNSVQQSILERNFAFKELTIRSLIAVIIGGIVGVTMAFLNFGVWSLVGQQICNALVQVIVLWKVSDWRPGFNFSPIYAKELFAFGINITGFNLINFFNRRSDDLLIGYFLGATALGYYSVAYRILIVMTEVLISMTTKVALPVFSRLQGEQERLKSAFYSATQFSSLISFPVFFCVPALAPELVKVLFGEQWTPSIPVMQILSFVGPVQVILFYNSAVMMALGKPSWRLWIQFINTFVNVVAFALVVRLGIAAVASAYVIRAYFVSPISLIAIKKLISINIIEYLSLYIGTLAACLATVATILATKYFLGAFVSAPILLAISILFGIPIYLLTLSFTSPNLFRKVLDLAENFNLKIKKKA